MGIIGFLCVVNQYCTFSTCTRGVLQTFYMCLIGYTDILCEFIGIADFLRETHGYFRLSICNSWVL